MSRRMHPPLRLHMQFPNHIGALFYGSLTCVRVRGVLDLQSHSRLLHRQEEDLLRVHLFRELPLQGR